MEPITALSQLDFGALLKYWRRARGLSQEELADLAGMSARGISDLERGARRTPKKSTVALLVTALHLATDDQTIFVAAARQKRVPLVYATALPTFLTPLVGRELLEAEAVRRLHSEAVRLLTLVGPAGIGKTRLAVQVATAVSDDFVDGVCFVQLATIHDAALVFPTIAATLGIRELSTQSPVHLVGQALATQDMLLFLDNCEQVLDAAPQLAALLHAYPQIKVLATSRAPLHIQGEQQLSVTPLALPDPTSAYQVSAVGQFASVQLFVQRAHDVNADFALTPAVVPAVITLCRRLDGIPLALELAAAWMKVLTPMMLVERLTQSAALPLLTTGSRDLPDRQQTMRGALDWSYTLLAPATQALFRRVSVFVGGWTLAACEAICAGDVEAHVLSSLAALVDASLVQQQQVDEEETRFYMLEPIREYGLSRLQTDERHDVFQRHAQYYSDFGEAVRPVLEGATQSQWLPRLAAEQGNIRAALQWMREQAQGTDGLRLAAAIWRFWYSRGYLREGRRWLEQFLAIGEQAPSLLRATACFGISVLASELGDYQQADAAAAQGSDLYRIAGNRGGLAALLNVRGNIAKHQGDFAAATTYFTECLAMWREQDFRMGIATALNNLATVALEQGEYAQAEPLQAESLLIKRELGDTRGEAVTLVNMADAARDQGEPLRARTLAQAAVDLFTTLHDPHGIALARNNLSEAYRDQGAYEPCEALLLQNLEYFRETEDAWGMAVTRKNLGDVAWAQGQAEQAVTWQRESVRMYHAEEDRLGVAECCEALGMSACQQTRYAVALTLFSAAAALRQLIHAPIPPADRGWIDREVALARSVLPVALSEAAWQTGQHLPWQSLLAATTW